MNFFFHGLIARKRFSPCRCYSFNYSMKLTQRPLWARPGVGAACCSKDLCETQSSAHHDTTPESRLLTQLWIREDSLICIPCLSNLFPEQTETACSSAQVLSLTTVCNKVFYHLMFTPGRRGYLGEGVSGGSPPSPPRVARTPTPPYPWREPCKTTVTQGKGMVTFGRENWGRLSAQGCGGKW